MSAFDCVDQHAVHQLLLGLRRRLRLDIGVSLFDRELRALVGGLQHGRLDAALLDRIAHIVGAVETDDDHVLTASGLQRRLGAHGHGVIAGDDALDVGIAPGGSTPSSNRLPAGSSSPTGATTIFRSG